MPLEIEAMVQQAHFPSPPAAILRITQAANDPNISAPELGKMIAAIPSFNAMILRLVNSSSYGLSTEVSSPEQAITMLGTRSMRNLAICHAARESVTKTSLHPQDVTLYWQDSFRRATIFRKFAELHPVIDPNEAFTIGVLLDLGLTILFNTDPSATHEWKNFRSERPEARRLIEQERFGTTHDQVITILNTQWGMPESLILPIVFHHDRSAPELNAKLREIAKMVAETEILAATFTAHDHRGAFAEACSVLETAYKLNQDEILTFLREVKEELTEAGDLFGINLGEQPSLENILAEVNKALVDQNTSYEELAQQLEESILEKERIEASLKVANARLERLAHHDTLTGLANRRKFAECLEEEINRAVRNGRPLSFLMIDLDHFKRLNDRYGHTFGDEVLRQIGSQLQRVSRKTNVCARLGGEEMCILMPETDEKKGRKVAERVRQVIASIRFVSPHQEVRCTASFGGSTCENIAIQPELAAERLMEEADKALYMAKNRGRNQTEWWNKETSSAQQNTPDTPTGTTPPTNPPG